MKIKKTIEVEVCAQCGTEIDEKRVMCAKCCQHKYDYDRIEANQGTNTFDIKYLCHKCGTETELTMQEIEFSNLVKDKMPHYHTQYGNKVVK